MSYSIFFDLTYYIKNTNALASCSLGSKKSDQKRDLIKYHSKKNAFLTNYFIHEVGQKYPNQKNFRLVGSKMTQSWLYEVESLEFSDDQKVFALEYDNARNDIKMLAIFKQIPERKKAKKGKKAHRHINLLIRSKRNKLKLTQRKNQTKKAHYVTLSSSDSRRTLFSQLETSAFINILVSMAFFDKKKIYTLFDLAV
ncbi:hypothetical protein BpHYR1_027524 [Brachionus plicatilis]|uniref:Uncharacterized protein n=1 Tax=Brachionus plicatilis TaxID=10195 RepID=A0A3M7SNG7_BRAPC|nr:hypothetical protein BpHYR1_027524 [Brachionus plicatilis]